MQYFLAKTEPNEYSIDDLKRLGKDRWNGVNNPVAIKHIKSMKLGDKVLIYHSGKTPSVVGLAEVVEEATPDPKNPRSWVPVLKFVKKFDLIVTLAEIKESKKFDDWTLVYQGRLSTMPVPEKFIDWIKEKGVKL